MDSNQTSTASVAAIGLPAAGLVLAGGLALAGLHAAAIISASVLMALTCVAGIFALKHHKSALAGLTEQLQAVPAAPPVSTNDEQLKQLQKEWVPTISGQLNSVKTQMDNAITELTHSFEDIHHKLGATSQLASDAAGTLGGGGTGLAEKVETSLRDMLGSINHALEEKVSMFGEVKSFISSTDELARMASSVEDLAAKTNLLALNAAIEAARAGEDGRGFSIVADEVRKLSMLSAETGQQIRRRVEEISQAARRAGEGATRMQQSDGKLLNYAQETVNDVVGSFQSVTEPLKHTSSQILDHTSDITNGLNNAVTHFQFQDRVCQIIGHVEDSLNTIQSQISRDGTLNVADLMAQLSKHYTMAEERMNHGMGASASKAAKSAPAPKSGDMDITFF